MFGDTMRRLRRAVGQLNKMAKEALGEADDLLQDAEEMFEMIQDEDLGDGQHVHVTRTVTTSPDSTTTTITKKVVKTTRKQ